MIVDKKLLDDLSAQAKANPRLRQAMDLRNSPEDMSQRMLNAIEPGTVMPIHRHLASSETVTLLRGKVRWHFYDDAGNKTESVILDANGDVRCINVEKGRWHSLECMESGDYTRLGRWWDRRGENEIDMIGEDELADKATFYEIKRQKADISIGLLMKKAEVMLLAIHEFKVYEIGYEGLSMEEM